MSTDKSALPCTDRTSINSNQRTGTKPIHTLMLCLLFGIMFSGTLNAQDKTPPFGLTLGYSLLDINSRIAAIDGQSESGFFIGATLDFEFGAKWGLAP